MEKVMIKKLPTNFGRLLGGEDFKKQESPKGDF